MSRVWGQGQQQGQHQGQQQGQRQGQQQAQGQAQPGGGDRERETPIEVQTDTADVEQGSTYLSSSVRKATIPAPALAWATTSVVAAALGMAVGLRRRACAVASVVMFRPDRGHPGQHSRKARRRRR